METLETVFSTEGEIIENLKKNAYILDYKKIFFEHLGPELNKIFINKKDKVYTKNFLEALQYEYGFFGNEIDLQKAFNTYKKYADLNDYFCMYKMHIIYLCEYEKFNVPLNRVLEKIYLLKCLAYVPNYIIDWREDLFSKIDIPYEIAGSLDLEDPNLEKHQRFFDLLYEQKEKYNLSESNFNLIKGVFFCCFNKEGSELPIISFSTLNSLIPSNDLDYAYYSAKNKCIFFNKYLNLNAISDSEIEKFYKEIENKKLYEFYDDYGNYLLNKENRANPKIIELVTEAAKKGFLFNSFRAYQCNMDYYDFDEIMQDYNKASAILDFILDEVVFEKLSLGQFVLLIGYLINYSKFPEKIISNYLIYIKEINDFISSTLNKKEKENEIIKEDDYYLFINKGYMYYFGFKGIEEQNLFKALEYLDKGINVTNKIYEKKISEFIKYNIKELMFNNKLITYDELIKAKKDLIEYFYKNPNLKYQIVDCYIIGEDFLEGIIRKKDDHIASLIYNSTKNIFCKLLVDCFAKNKIKKFLQNHENKIENKFKDEICCICYTNKVSKIFIPCKHCFCDFCTEKLEKDSKKCPYCRTEYLFII